MVGKKITKERISGVPKGREEIAAAMKEVEASPGKEEGWERLEKLAGEKQRPDEVADLYRRMLGREKGIARRALAFHEEWFGDDPDAITDVLKRILSIEPDAEWAFDRLCVELTQACRWDDLLSVYDRALGREMEAARRKSLLDGAAHVAKDFADEPERALGYLGRLLELEPGNAHLLASLERLYERLGRWNELVELWRMRIPAAGPEAGSIRLRIASTYLDRLGEHGRALEELRMLVSVDPGHEGSLAMLERLLGDEKAPKEVRLGALGLLRSSYDGAKRDEDAVRVIEKGLTFVDRGEVLRKELARRLAALGREEEAMEHFAALLASSPGDGEARRSLVDLAGRTGRHEVLAQALERAAGAAEGALQASLLAAAAEVHRASLLDDARAIDLYLRVLDLGDADASVMLAAARTLDDLLAKAGRAKERLAVLERLADIEQSSSTRRFVVGEAAKLAEEMGEGDAVVKKWRSRLRMDEGDLEALDSLAGLYEKAGEWKELAHVLGLRAGARVPALQRRSDLVRKALAEEKLGDVDGAVETLLGVVREFGYDAETVDALDEALASAGRWGELARVLEEASAIAHGRAGRLLERLGGVFLERLDQPRRALESYLRAIAQDPRSEAARMGLRSLVTIEDCALGAAEALSRAYEATGDGEAALGLVEAHAEAAGEPAAKAGILARAARIHEERGGDAEAALELVARAFELTPEDRLLEESLRRLGEAAGRPHVVADALGQAARACAKHPLRAAELLCERGKILAAAKDEVGALEAFEAAMELGERIVRTDHDANLLVAALQRREPGPRLVDTLLGLDDLAPRSLDALHEAAEVALGHAGRDLARSTLERLYLRGSRMLVGGMEAEGSRSAAESTAWALEKLVELHRKAGEDDRAARLLVDGALLPLEPGRLRDLRLGAASILMKRGEVGRAMSLFHEILEQDPDDVETLRRAARVCEEQGRITELMALRLIELDATGEKDRRLDLRLEISRLAGTLEERGGRVESLLANLEEEPGHAPTIELLVDVLSGRGQHERLVAILAEQAPRVAEPGRQAEMWARVARIAEAGLGDPQRAIEAWERVVDLDVTDEALDALARLHAAAGRPEAAAPWLERRLSRASEQERPPTLLRLARAHLDAGHAEKAAGVLEAAFEEAPRNAEVRRLLVDLHRRRGDWGALVRVLSAAAGHVKDESTILAYAVEVHEICRTRLGAPERSVVVLEKALAVAPDERDLKLRLSEALVAAGRYGEAQRILEDLVEGYGRRRSPDRAALHLALARVARAQGDAGAALEQLEAASKMDVSNADILVALADLARECGKIDRAEHALRTLLVNMRNRPDGPWPIGKARVQIELGRIAEEQGQKDKAAELRESAIESISNDDTQAAGLQADLREHGEVELLTRVLETRLARVTNPRTRSGILAEIAELSERDLDDPERALDFRIQAVETDPVFPPHHEAAQELARRLGRIERYVSSLESLLEQARRGSDAYVRCELLLRLGEVMQKDRRDHKRAADLYAQAGETGVREVDVWRVRVGLATETGDAKEKARLLGLLASVGEDKADAHASALFTIAEVQLSTRDTLGEGLEALRKALERDPRYDRAGRIMEQSRQLHGESREFRALWEEIARRSEDERILLGFLETQASGAEATHGEVREAAELALKLGQGERAEGLLLRAVETGRDETGWAALSLSRRRLKAGDLDGAVRWLREAVAASDMAGVLEVGREIARLSPEGAPDLVAGVYEGLLERHPSDRAVWETLASIYARAGDVGRLSDLVDGTLDSLESVADRSALRLIYANALLARGRGDEAVEVLRTVLSEQPDNAQAQSTLVECLERSGRTEDLAGILETRLAAARKQGDLEATRTLSLGLGRLREPDDAARVYREAMEVLPGDEQIVEALLAVLPAEHDPAERAALMERILATKRGDEAADYALELAEIHNYLDNADGVQRVLEVGFAAAPSNVQILARLENLYGSRGEHEALAQRLLEAARHMTEKGVRVGLIMKAGRLYREQLSDPAAAAGALEEAARVCPGDPRVVLELAAAARDAGQSMKAVDTLTALLAGDPGAWRLETLRMRAALWTSLGDHEAAVDDLEEAFRLDASLAPDLERALGMLRTAASKEGVDAERGVVMRIVDLLAGQNLRARARKLLEDWVASRTGDLDVLRRLRDFDLEDGNWEGVAEDCKRLAGLEKDKARINAVLDMAHAYMQLGRAQDAREQMESVHRDHPDSVDVRAALRAIYEALGVNEELARLLREEAESTANEAEKVALLGQAAELYVKAGQSGLGVEVLESLFALRPGDAQVGIALADALVDRYESERAAAVIDKVLADTKGRRPQEMSPLLLRRARIAGAAQQYDVQLKHLEQAFKIDRRNTEIVAEVANVAEKLGNFDLALQALRNVPLVEGSCAISVADSFLRQARILVMLGDSKRALMCARKALKEDPASDEAAKLVSELM